MKGVFLIFVILFSQMVSGQTVTFAEDIAELVYSHCSTCHRNGEIGPMSLTNYDEIKEWGAMIQFVTESKFMPPWQPDPGYSRFLGENFLSESEIEKIAQWVDDGMPRGDQTKEPPFPTFPTGSVLGTPDLVLEMAEEHLHKGTNVDDYRYFVLPSGLTEDKIIKAIEFRPGNTQIVHHALVFEDVTGEAAEKDAATPEYGFSGFGSFTNGGPGVLSQKQYPGYVPGQKPILFPDGVGQVLRAGSDVVIQVHYAPWPVDETDRSKLNIFFADQSEKIEREVGNHIMVPVVETINEAFVIPPGIVKEFHGEYEVPVDVSLIGLTPHMHLLGKHWEIYLEKKSGETVNLIKINDWDFNWQGSYSFNRYIVAEKGDVIHAIASYDNTLDNPNNPSDPPNWVSWGEKTTDEMYYLPISYVLYKEGDENIVFDDVTTSDDVIKGWEKEPFIEIHPNPSEDLTNISFGMTIGESVNISLYNQKGQLVRILREKEFFNIGNHTVNIQTKDLKPGIYHVQIQGSHTHLVSRMVKN